MSELVFVLSLFGVFFAYFGYPLTLVLISGIRLRANACGRAPDSVTLIITVHNEERRIREKLENSMSIERPWKEWQIIVASDGSSDRTNDIVMEYADRGVELLEIAGRGGKENAQREAVRKAKGDVLVFSDVATGLEPSGLRQLVSGFRDPSVGCVSSEDRLISNTGQPSGEGAYVRYEMWLRRLESRAGSLVGLSGSLFAARRDVCKDFSSEMQSDFRTVLNSVRLGLRGISDPKAIGIYMDIGDPSKEWDRKVRTIVRGLTVFFKHAELLNPFQYGLFAYQLFCHKLLRWLVPVFLATALVSNVLLATESVGYQVLLAVHLSFYAVGALGWFVGGSLLNYAPIKIPTFFLKVNCSIVVAWWRYLRGDRIVTWTPTVR